jgi:hypothetical protein
MPRAASYTFIYFGFSSLLSACTHASHGFEYPLKDLDY